MKLLVIGGGRFVGRHLVDAALARGDDVTVFNRGQSRSDWPGGVQVLQGDRHGDLAMLASHGPWDAVIDTCAYRPAEVQRMAAALKDRVGAYALISSISVYASLAQPNDEASPLATIDDADPPQIDGRTYGPLKARCEAALQAGGMPALVLRPGLIVGPHDPTDRFTYWPARIAAAVPDEPVLVPGSPDDPVQVIDVRDLVDFLLLALSRGLRGTFNLTSPPLRWGDLLDACIAAAIVQPRLVWVDAARIESLGLAPWSDLPVWLPPLGDSAGLHRTVVAAALAAGLTMRPLAHTVADTLAWQRERGADAAWPRGRWAAGLTPAREREALVAVGA